MQNAILPTSLSPPSSYASCHLALARIVDDAGLCGTYKHQRTREGLIWERIHWSGTIDEESAGAGTPFFPRQTPLSPISLARQHRVSSSVSRTGVCWLLRDRFLVFGPFAPCPCLSGHLRTTVRRVQWLHENGGQTRRRQCGDK